MHYLASNRHFTDNTRQKNSLPYPLRMPLNQMILRMFSPTFRLDYNVIHILATGRIARCDMAIDLPSLNDFLDSAFHPPSEGGHNPFHKLF